VQKYHIIEAILFLLTKHLGEIPMATVVMELNAGICKNFLEVCYMSYLTSGSLLIQKKVLICSLDLLFLCIVLYAHAL